MRGMMYIMNSKLARKKRVCMLCEWCTLKKIFLQYDPDGLSVLM